MTPKWWHLHGHMVSFTTSGLAALSVQDGIKLLRKAHMHPVTGGYKVGLTAHCTCQQLLTSAHVPLIWCSCDVHGCLLCWGSVRLQHLSQGHGRVTRRWQGEGQTHRFQLPICINKEQGFANNLLTMRTQSCRLNMATSKPVAQRQTICSSRSRKRKQGEERRRTKTCPTFYRLRLFDPVHVVNVAERQGGGGIVVAKHLPFHVCGPHHNGSIASWQRVVPDNRQNHRHWKLDQLLDLANWPFFNWWRIFLRVNFRSCVTG